ncbi:MAG: alpha/beta fold hydrolase [Cellvibrionaceae bacterium]
MKDLSLKTSEQLSFEVHGLNIQAQAWGEPQGLPVLAIHGWLDSSASYFRLAPLLEGCYVVAIDCAGHGRSDRRLGQEPYNIWQDIGELFAVADALGWDRFALIGHSRGAIISTLAAGTFPERISHLALLDGMLPQPMAADQAPQQLAQSIKDTQRQRRQSVYDDLEPMIQARMHGLWSLSRSAATALVERGVIKNSDGGYRWSSDPLLKAASSMKLTREQSEAFVERIEAPVKLLLAEGGTVARYPDQIKALDTFAPEVLAGTHHFHMEEQAELVAERLLAFLL